MLDVIQWLVAVELIGLAFLPLTVWAMSRLPDRGYIFSKALGLLLATYVTWLAGSFVPVARSTWLPALITVIGAAGWWFLPHQTISALKGVRSLILAEEVLFIAALVLLSLLRVQTFGSGIGHTEQFMDMALMNSSYHSASFPPADPWMSGHTINYYYFGYLIFATLAKLSGVALPVAYNLALSTVFGLVVAGCYSIAYALSRHPLWSLLGSAFVALIGNWHALLWGLFHGSCAQPSLQLFWASFWPSTRVIGAGYTLPNWACSSGAGSTETNISEYPLFSFVLGDLHPHVMALPFTLLAIALGLSVLFSDRPLVVERSLQSIGKLLLIAVSVGALFTINSWDFPTYLLVVGACVAAGAYLLDDRPNWWRQPLAAVIAIAVASVVLFAPFYLHFRSLAHGVGAVTTPSDLYEFLQAFGYFVLACGLFVFVLSLLLQPAGTEDEEEMPAEPVLAGETGQSALDFASGSSRSGLLTWVVVVLLGIVAIVAHRAVFVLLLILAIAALVMLHRVLNSEEPNRGDVAALIATAVGCAVIALPEVMYLRDSFDASAMYRMNSIFKFYYQGWTLLGLAGAYGVYRVCSVLRSSFSVLYGWVALAALGVGLLGAAPYTVWAFSAQPGDATARSLDGEAWMDVSDHGDYAGIQWLQSHAPEGSVVLEAVGDDYNSSAARVSTFTGLPTVMGWIGHEAQWRGADPDIETRAHDVATIYTTSEVNRAKALLRKYGVRYVFVGQTERTKYSPSLTQLQKFGGFMRAVYRAPGVTIYSW